MGTEAARLSLAQVSGHLLLSSANLLGRRYCRSACAFSPIDPQYLTRSVQSSLPRVFMSASRRVLPT